MTTPNTDYPRITLAISLISHGQAELAQRSLSTLANHTVGLDVQVIITHNLVEEGTFSMPGGAIEVQHVRNARPLGFARNHNQAFRLVSGEYFCILNPDLVFVEDVFRPLIQDIQQGLGDIVAPLVFDPQGRQQDSFRTLPSPGELLLRRLAPKRGTEVRREGPFLYPDWIAGMFLLMRSETYRRLGGLDEGYYLYFEDVDFGCRARLAGFRLAVDSRCRIVHQARRQSHRSLRYFLRHLHSTVRFFSSSVYRDARKLTARA